MKMIVHTILTIGIWISKMLIKDILQTVPHLLSHRFKGSIERSPILQKITTYFWRSWSLIWMSQTNFYWQYVSIVMSLFQNLLLFQGQKWPKIQIFPRSRIGNAWIVVICRTFTIVVLPKPLSYELTAFTYYARPKITFMQLRALAPPQRCKLLSSSAIGQVEFCSIGL